MPWIYHQRTGQIYFDNSLVDTGYSGKGAFKNKPEHQGKKNQGPIPRGEYTIGGATHSKGPMTIILTPKRGNIMYGRGDFRIHGDSIKNPGSASEGCIIVGSVTRTKILNSKDKQLLVVE
ncbi:tlde1 domain-containing protein [Serratia sp. CY85251]|uniref:tlde1 domain-containing protein n=1 Tax=Serratia sp. CY85251 TaxID=3383696 RepID=UPI003F9EBCD8